MYKSNRRKTGKRKLWLLCAVLLTGLVSGCRSTQETVEETGGYYGRDCVMCDGCLYWNSGVWYDGQQKALPEDALQVGEIAAAADAVPEGQLESALLPAGTQVYASESEKSLFIRQDGGYVQYQPMEGMQEEVEEVLAVRPTGEVPGYEYVEADCIYYSGCLYWEESVLADSADVSEDREELGYILCRADEVPAADFYSAASDAGDVVCQSDSYPGRLLVWHRQRDVWQLYAPRNTDADE